MHAVRKCGNGYCQNLGLNFDSFHVCPGNRQAIGERRERGLDVAHLNSLNTFCLLASLYAIASVDVLNVFIGLNALYGFARLDSLNVPSRPAFLHTTTGLHAVHALFARLNTLYGFARLTALSAFAGLNSL